MLYLGERSSRGPALAITTPFSDRAMTDRKVRLLTLRVGGVVVLLALCAAITIRFAGGWSWGTFFACVAAACLVVRVCFCVGFDGIELLRKCSSGSSWQAVAPLGARELTVLFVDIRGYTSLTETMSSEQVFLTVASYARRVSQIIKARCGHVLEFAGDGVLAVFETERGSADKESRAVAAAFDLARAFAASSSQFAVGVGIATGDAYVGVINLQERRVRGALGNVTNLASRLQTMTRQLDATILIDACTHARAGAANTRFSRLSGVQIRGRKDPIDVYAYFTAQKRRALNQSSVQLRAVDDASSQELARQKVGPAE